MMLLLASKLAGRGELLRNAFELIDSLFELFSRKPTYVGYKVVRQRSLLSGTDEVNPKRVFPLLISFCPLS